MFFADWLWSAIAPARELETIPGVLGKRTVHTPAPHMPALPAAHTCDYSLFLAQAPANCSPDVGAFKGRLVRQICTLFRRSWFWYSIFSPSLPADFIYEHRCSRPNKKNKTIFSVRSSPPGFAQLMLQEFGLYPFRRTFSPHCETGLKTYAQLGQAPISCTILPYFHQQILLLQKSSTQFSDTTMDPYSQNTVNWSNKLPECLLLQKPSTYLCGPLFAPHCIKDGHQFSSLLYYNVTKIYYYQNFTSAKPCHPIFTYLCGPMFAPCFEVIQKRRLLHLGRAPVFCTNLLKRHQNLLLTEFFFLRTLASNVHILSWTHFRSTLRIDPTHLDLGRAPVCCTNLLQRHQNLLLPEYHFCRNLELNIYIRLWTTFLCEAMIVAHRERIQHTYI